MKEQSKEILKFRLIVMILTLLLAGICLYYLYNEICVVSTKDAKVACDLFKITPQISSKLMEFDVKDGDTVVKDQIIGRMGGVGLVDSNIEQAVLRVPTNGIIVKKEARPGEFCPAGSTLAEVFDPTQIYITANIEETKIQKIAPGQSVDIEFDEFKGILFKGNVDSIGQAANSAFSPQQPSSGGTYNKVVQTIPVKIIFEKNEKNFLPGTNAEVKIYTK